MLARTSTVVDPLPPALADLHAAYMAAVERCASLGMFSEGPIDEAAYAEAKVELDRCEAAWLEALGEKGGAA